MRRWKTSTMMMIGMVTTTEAAAIEPAGKSNCELPVKNAIAAGTVRARLVDVSDVANRKSFQAKMKTRIAEVKTPGAARGAMIRRNAWNGVAPSTRAALSRSHGISRKNADSVQMASGSVKVMYGMIRPGQVSNRCSARHMLNSGPMIAI